ncbi:MAG TPA: O-antigen ligase family protein [Bacteroidia bacterium]|nr:O-antigen ligase family protein [Bacteroidia bacterium]
MVNETLGVAAVALSVVMLKLKGMYKELILGLFFLLVMSDSRQSEALYAAQAKNIYIVLLSLFYFFDRKNFTGTNDYFKPFILFFIWSAAMLMQAPSVNFMNSAMKTLSYILLFTVVPGYFIKAFRELGESFIKEVIMLFCCILLIGIVMIPLFPNTVFLVGRFCGVYGNPNGIGIACTLLFMLVFISLKKFPGLLDQNETRIVYGLIILSTLLAVSRNTMMSIVIFLLFARFYEMGYLAGFAILVVALVAYELINQNIVAIVEALGLGHYLRAEAIEDGSGRLIAWRAAWKQIQSQFFLGRGFAYDEWYFYENRHWLSALGHQGGVHNSWLAIWMNTGLIGLILFAIGFIKTFVKAMLHSKLAFPVLFAVIFSASFEAWIMGSLNPFHIVLILILNFIINIDQFNADREEESVVPIS